uniref:Small nuclear ribonucleoprotein E n=1 Tax=Lactuca sativa TaxID=4236 RepID=A0A9R1VBK8_LACSA|nr:hypothetical protein LSAT_V11C500278450 [Lactuca sativa]
MATKVQRIMTQPINLIFRFLQSKARIQIWLFEQKDLRIEGRIIGFDEYMNLVLDEAEEVSIKKKTRKPLGESDEEHLHQCRLKTRFASYVRHCYDEGNCV